MAGVPQKTLNWLYDVLKREYRDPNRTYSDLAYVLSRYPGFRPRTDVYTFENGSSALLVHFQGTIPVNFRGNTYQFPISLWVPHTYPYDAPIAYVTPTDDMAIRPGQYVGGDGRLYHPYLAHWREAWERSNLIDFLSILSEIFAKEPPVVSRVQQQQQQQPQQRPPLVPPLPREIQPHPPSNVPVSNPQPGRASPGPPPPPPKDPAQGGRVPAPPSPSPPMQRPGRYDAPPPLPPQAQPPGQGQSRPQPSYGSNNVQRPLSGMNYMPQRTSSLRQSTPVQQPQQQPGYDHQQPHYHSQPPQPGEIEHQQYPYSRQHQQPPQGPGPRNLPPQGYDQQWQRPSPGPQAYNEPPPSQHFRQGVPPPIQQHQQPHLQAPQHPHPQQPPYQHPPHPPQPPKPAPAPALDLLDSPFDIPLPTPTTSATAILQNPNIPAPPIPVNPEKEALLTALSHHLTQSLHGQIAQSTSALPALSSQHTALQSTMQILGAELANLQTLHSTLSSNLTLLSTSLSKSDKVITSAHSRSAANDIPAIDEMLVPPTVVARQLYDAACEERGIEAAILALQEGFVRGRIGGDVWSRRTRELAREGFKRRWMERKVGRGMALDMGMLGNGV